MTPADMYAIGNTIVDVLEDLAERIEDRADGETGDVFRALDLTAMCVRRSAADLLERMKETREGDA